MNSFIWKNQQSAIHPWKTDALNFKHCCNSIIVPCSIRIIYDDDKSRVQYVTGTFSFGRVCTVFYPSHKKCWRRRISCLQLDFLLNKREFFIELRLWDIKNVVSSLKYSICGNQKDILKWKWLDIKLNSLTKCWRFCGFWDSPFRRAVVSRFSFELFIYFSLSLGDRKFPETLFKLG